MAKKKQQKSLDKWTKQKWRTASGKPSTQGSEATGEVYAPAKTIAKLKSTKSGKKKTKSSQPKRKELLVKKVSNMLDMVYIKGKKEVK